MSKKKPFELVGVGTPTNSSGIPVTYTSAGGCTTVYVFGLHPSNVMDRDDDDCKVIDNRELAENAVQAIGSIWRWFDDMRNAAVADYLFEQTEQERREERKAASLSLG